MPFINGKLAFVHNKQFPSEFWAPLLEKVSLCFSITVLKVSKIKLKHAFLNKRLLPNTFHAMVAYMVVMKQTGI